MPGANEKSCREYSVATKWTCFNKKADFEGLARTFGISPYTARVIRNRDIVTEEEFKEYLFRDFESLKTLEEVLSFMEPPEAMKGIPPAVQLLHKTIREGGRIRIFGDYDVDGNMSIVILMRAIFLAGGRVDWRVPHRMRDGYGLNVNMIREAIDDGISLAITCDNGIAALEPIRVAKEAGMQVIVTDHHQVVRRPGPDGELVPVLPEADVCIDPHQPDCPSSFKEICGAMVAWKFMLAYFDFCLPERKPLLSTLIPHVAFATVCDVMPLVKDNRFLVKYGIWMFHHRQIDAAMLNLCAVKAVLPEDVRAESFGFYLGPMINAGGRLETAELAVKLFLADDLSEAAELASRLRELNEERKQMTNIGENLAMDEIDRLDLLGMNTPGREPDKVLVVYLPKLHESVAGLVSSHLSRRFCRPSIVLTDSAEEGICKGSGRSVEGYHILNGLNGCQEYLTKFGGHEGAAGLSLPKEKIDAFRKKINELCELKEEELVRKIRVDLPVSPSAVNDALVEEMALLEPCGKGNEAPVFAVDRAEVRLTRDPSSMKNGTLRLGVRTKEGERESAMILFRRGEEFLYYYRQKFGIAEEEKMATGAASAVRATLSYHASFNEFRGTRSVQYIVDEFK